jgi:hypothetical protein
MYLSDDRNLQYVLNATSLSKDELETIVGKFKSNHHAWPNKFKGEYIEDWDGNKKIVHHFTKRILWKEENVKY